jgi:hypothetical protein
LLETPPFRVVKSAAMFLLKFWLKSESSIASPKLRFDGWRVVDDDDYSQAVGKPKRKV